MAVLVPVTVPKCSRHVAKMVALHESPEETDLVKHDIILVLRVGIKWPNSAIGF
jgi:hypothetical protein